MYKGFYDFEEIDGIWIIQEPIPEGTPQTKPLDAAHTVQIETERFALRVQLGSTETESFVWPYMSWLRSHGAVKMNVAHFANNIYRNGVPHRYNALAAEVRRFGGDMEQQCFANCSVCGGELSYYMCRANCEIMHLVEDALSGLKMLCIQGSMKEEGSVYDHYCWPTQELIERLYKPLAPASDTLVQFHTQPLKTA